MKKNYWVLIILLAFLSIYLISENLHTYATKNEETSIESLFESDLIYDDASHRFGIYSMGVDQNLKILVIGMGETYKGVKKDVEKYFDKQLENIGLDDYTVEVNIYKEADIKNLVE